MMAIIKKLIKHIKEDWWLYAFIVIYSLFTLINYKLMNRDFWIDESFSYLFSQLPISFIFDSNDVHYPVFIMFARMAQYFTTDFFYLRVIIFAFSLLSPIIVYGMTKKYFNKNVSIMFLFLYLITPMFAYFNTEYRSYFLLFIVVPINFYLFNIAIDNNKINAPFIAYLLTSALLIYIHYMTAFYIITQYLYIFYKFKFKNIIINSRTIIFAFGFVLLIIPAITYFIHTLPKYTTTWYAESNLLSIISAFAYLFALPSQSNYYQLLFLSIFFLLIAMHIYLKPKIPPYHKQILDQLLFFIFVPILMMFFSSYFTNVYHHRYVCYLSIFVLMFMAYYSVYYVQIQNTTFKKFYITIFICSIILLSSFTINENYNTHINYSYDFIEQQFNLSHNPEDIIIEHKTMFTYLPYKALCKHNNINCTNYLIQNIDRKKLFSIGGSVLSDSDFNPQIPENKTILIIEEKANQSNIIFEYDNLVVIKKLTWKNVTYQ